MTVPAVQQLGGAVIVQGAALEHLKACVLALMREMRSNGFAPPPALADLLIKAHAAAGMSAPRHEFAESDVLEPHSRCQGVDDWIDVAEAAALWSVSRRQAQRLALQLTPGDAKRIGTSWALKRAPALALAEQRRRQQ